MKWHHDIELARPLPYDGEKVWKTGDWFAGPLYPGPRLLIDLRGREFPSFIDSKLGLWSTGGKLRMEVWDGYQDETDRVVLDGVVGTEGPDRRVDFYTITRGMHLPPGATLFCDDLYAWKVFKAGAGTLPFTRRRKKLRSVVDLIDSERLRVTPYKRVTSRDEFETLKRNCLSVEGVGLILRRDAAYEAGRSGNILKIGPA